MILFWPWTLNQVNGADPDQIEDWYQRLPPCKNIHQTRMMTAIYIKRDKAQGQNPNSDQDFHGCGMGRQDAQHHGAGW